MTGFATAYGYSSAILDAVGEARRPLYSVPLEGTAGLPTLNDLIDLICGDADNYEAGEVPPTAKATNDLKRLLDDASMTRNAPLPLGDVAPYQGEVSVTWRNGERMVRATSFSDNRSARIDFGTTPDGALGEYQFDPEATGTGLADKLIWLFGTPNNDPAVF